MFNGLSCAEDVHLHLLFCDVEQRGNLFVGFAFKVAKLYALALLHRQAVDDLSHKLHLVTLLRSLVRVISCVLKVDALLVERGVLVVMLAYSVESEVTADGYAESLY